MGFLDRLRRLLKGHSTADADGTASTEVKDSTTLANDSTRHMKSVNSIAFSSDLNTLYLIDDGRAIAFPLDSRGIQVALVNEQLSAVSPLKEVVIPRPAPEAAPPDPDLALEKNSRVSLLKRPEGKEIRLKIDPRDQYTPVFNPDSGVLAIIGSTDIISTLEAPDRDDLPAATCRQFLFDLKEEVVLIRKVGQLLSIQTKKRK
jgi:hypothetical protein